MAVAAQRPRPGRSAGTARPAHGRRRDDMARPVRAAPAHRSRRRARATGRAHARRPRRPRDDRQRRHRVRAGAAAGAVRMNSLDARTIAAATLAALPHITANRLRRLLQRCGDPTNALAAVRRGDAASALRANDPEAHELARTWRRVADPDAIAREVDERGTHVWVEGD